MSEKIIGYSLLIVGILIILFSGFSVYTVFTKQAEPVKLFNLPSVTMDVSQIIQSSLPQEFAGLGNTPSSAPKQEIITARMVNEPLNLSAHLFLMGFIASVGYKLGGLGVMLLRPVVVKMKEQQSSLSKQ